VGDTAYAVVDGRLHTHAALSKQLDRWFAEFDEVRIAAHRVDAPDPGFRALDRDDIELVSLPSAGGSGWKAKVGVAATLLTWVRMLVPLLRRATAVHLRTPCNVTLVAIPLARILCPRRYAIYAGTWEGTEGVPRSYRFQRDLLRRWGGVVHAYVPVGDDLPANIRPNVSPSFSLAELDALAPAVEQRVERIQSEPLADRPMRICCVGTFSPLKNQTGLVRAAQLLAERGIPLEIRFAGAGRTQDEVRFLVDRFGLDGVRFLGQVDHASLRELYAWADVNALVARGEGFGKIFPEGMAVGCPALCGNGLMQLGIVGGGTRGRQADPDDPASIADALEALHGLSVDEQLAMVQACTDYARTCTIDAFADEVRHIVHDIWALPTPTAGSAPSSPTPDPARP
jgi:glycosyltransferase involved in cell wall biosynthesis